MQQNTTEECARRILQIVEWVAPFERMLKIKDLQKVIGYHKNTIKDACYILMEDGYLYVKMKRNLIYLPSRDDVIGILSRAPKFDEYLSGKKAKISV